MPTASEYLNPNLSKDHSKRKNNMRREWKKTSTGGVRVREWQDMEAGR